MPSAGRWLTGKLRQAFTQLWSEPASQPSGLQAAVEWLGEALREQGPLRMWTRSGRDQLVAPGEGVELSLDLGLLLGRPAVSVEFLVDGTSVGTAPIDDRSVALSFVPQAPGLFRVEAIPRDAEAAEIGMGHARSVSWLHVVDTSPTVAVDADAVLDAGRDLSALGRLAARGWETCYVDVAPDDREGEIRAAIEAQNLPRGAVLVHPEEEAEFKTLGLDFRRAFGLTCLRRVRGVGVPVGLLVSDSSAARALFEAEGLTVVDVDGLEALDDERLAAFEAQAAEEVAERDARGRDVSWRLDRMTGTRVCLGNACRIELDNRRAREAVLGAIQGARRSVHLQVYILDEGRFAELLATHLIRRAREGVRVRVLVDALYSGQSVPVIRNAVADVLRAEPNVEVLGSSPLEPGALPDAASLKHRDHRKLIVVDSERAFVSGRNAGDAYYTGFDEVPVTDATPHDRIPWLDAHIEIQGPAVRAIQEGFLRDWARSGGAAPAGALPDYDPVGDSAVRVVLQGRGDAVALAAYEAILDGAKSHVFLLNGFPVFPTLARAIRRAVSRGVRVVLISGCALTRRRDGSFLPGPLHRELLEFLTKQRLEPLLAAGVEVYEYQTLPTPLVVARGGVLRPYVHAKVVSADGRFVSVGSANLDATASYWEREANLVVEDPNLVRDLEAQLEAMVEQSHRIDTRSDLWVREAPRRALTAGLWPDALYS